MDWEGRMDDGVSVFDRDVKLPSYCPDFSMVPQLYLGWYKDMFLHGNREIPPDVDKLMVGQAVSRIVVSKGSFIVNLVNTYDDTIKGVYYFYGKRYVVTNSFVYEGKDKVFTFKSSIEKYRVELADAFDADPVIGYLDKDLAKFVTFEREDVGEIPAEDMMVYNGAIYTVHNGKLVENTFEKFGKLHHKTKKLSDIYETH